MLYGLIALGIMLDRVCVLAFDLVLVETSWLCYKYVCERGSVKMH